MINDKPDIMVIKKGFLFIRPVLWLMCPYKFRPSESFQVGEFRSWSDALLAQKRLTTEIYDRSTFNHKSS